MFALLFVLVIGAGVGLLALPRLFGAQGQATPRVQIPTPSPIKQTSAALAPTVAASTVAPASPRAISTSVTALPTVVVLPTNTPPRTNTATPTRTPTITLTPLPTPTRTPKPPGKAVFTDGARTMYLDSGVVRVGVDKDWDGAIREIWFNGQNLVNNWDGGRLIAVSIYDGDAKTGWDVNNPDWGWNPCPSDKYSNPNKPIIYSFDNGILYVKTRYTEWNPDNKDGGKGRPVYSDVVVETWYKFLADDPRALNLKFRVTHEGKDNHTLAGQEIGFAYVRVPFNRFISYSGNAPWSSAPISIENLPPFKDVGPNSQGTTAAAEQWAGFVNAEDVGLLEWAPQSYPMFGRAYFPAERAEAATYYMGPRAFFAVGPGFSKEIETYFFAGRWQDARALFNRLRQEVNLPDVMHPMGHVDAPRQNATLTGTIDVAGWAIDDRNLSRVEIFLDGARVGQARYGTSRGDVIRDYPGLSGAPNFGFVYQLNTRAYANGSHVLQVRAMDAAGNISQLKPGELTINIRN